MGITISDLEVLRDREKSARVSTEAYEDSRGGHSARTLGEVTEVFLAMAPMVIELMVKFPLVRRADLTGIKFSR